MMTGTCFQAAWERSFSSSSNPSSVRQHHVEQHEVHGVAALDPLDRLAPIGDGLDGKALLLGEVAEQVRHVHIVLDDQQPLWSRIQGLDP